MHTCAAYGVGEEEKVKKPSFFFLGGITEEQVKHKVFML